MYPRRKIVRNNRVTISAYPSYCWWVEVCRKNLCWKVVVVVGLLASLLSPFWVNYLQTLYSITKHLQEDLLFMPELPEKSILPLLF
jgi:hypothetical protein